MKFASLSSLVVLLVCLLGTRCEEKEVIIADQAEHLELDEFLDIQETEEESNGSDSAIAEAVESPTWGQWFSSLIWKSEEAAVEEKSADSHDFDDEDVHHDDELIEESGEKVVDNKKSTKKVVILSVVIVVAVLAVIGLAALYFIKRGKDSA
ncbi:hypothetical protein XU18_4540 [Perkinsela sp. CCAP 1560/4]|nr:hypothetical protein XU18_4540 [Perkinsela sp. CCAP 1560/4]|eukprot:KNH04186.1 hypothetical protein XU18_4540 [Perkinsela sp. CCAP 1560/4]